MTTAAVPATGPAPALGAPEQRGRKRRGSIVTEILGVVGEAFITAGLLLALFVVWQLFYTDVSAARIQQAQLDTISWAEPVRVPIQPAAAPSEAAPEVEVLPVIPQSAKVYSPDGAPVLPADLAELTTFGVLHVPRWGPDYAQPISQGTDRQRVLDRLGIGHYEQTQMPGEIGNFAIAGHRTTYGKPFANVDLLQVGDALVVQTEDAWYVYKVTGSDIVLPEQGEVIAPVPNDLTAEPSNAVITLTSCHPKFSAEKRYIVWGELVYWAPTGLGYPSEIVDGV